MSTTRAYLAKAVAARWNKEKEKAMKLFSRCFLWSLPPISRHTLISWKVAFFSGRSKKTQRRRTKTFSRVPNWQLARWHVRIWISKDSPEVIKLDGNDERNVKRDHKWKWMRTYSTRTKNTRPSSIIHRSFSKRVGTRTLFRRIPADGCLYSK